MSAVDVTDQVTGAADSSLPNEDDGKARFQRWTALLIAVIAVLLAINSLGGNNAAEDALNNNILASDSWAFFQAKNVRQTVYRLAVDDLATRLELEGDTLPPAARQALQARIEAYQATVDRYESEPDPDDPTDFLKGEGKRELSQRALYYEAQRNEALARDGSFDIAEALFQIAIVLASVAILATSRPARMLAILFALIAVGFMANGYLLLVDLP
jgi:hypothetical protein